MTIVIDSTTYDVPIISINRKAEMLYKFAERTVDGILHSELIGEYTNFDVVMGMSKNNVSDYAALFLKLTEPVTSHTITILGTSFSCYFAGIKDEVVKDKGTPYFRNLGFSVIATSPTRTP